MPPKHQTICQVTLEKGMDDLLQTFTCMQPFSSLIKKVTLDSPLQISPIFGPPRTTFCQWQILKSFLLELAVAHSTNDFFLSSFKSDLFYMNHALYPQMQLHDTAPLIFCDLHIAEIGWHYLQTVLPTPCCLTPAWERHRQKPLSDHTMSGPQFHPTHTLRESFQPYPRGLERLNQALFWNHVGIHPTNNLIQNITGADLSSLFQRLWQYLG